MAKTQGRTLHRCVKLLFKTCTPGFAIVLNYGPVFCISKAFYFLEVSKTACQPHAACRVGRAGLKGNQPTESCTLPHCIGHSFGAVSLHCLSLLKSENTGFIHTEKP